jgi:hypothetical protein
MGRLKHEKIMWAKNFSDSRLTNLVVTSSNDNNNHLDNRIVPSES